MTITDLRDWIEVLDNAGELHRISVEVDPNLELSQIVDRVSKEQGSENKALLFENVKGSSMPVLVNAFGSMKRMALSLGVEDVEEHAERLRELLDQAPPESLVDKLKMLPKLLGMAKWMPKTISSAPCQEVVIEAEDVNLADIPVLTTWPDDAGPFITFPLCVTNDPESGRRNLGTYRLQVMSKNTTGFHSHRHKDARRHLNKAQSKGERIPVAVAIGADPATCFASVIPAPPDIDELLIAGFLRNKAVELVDCKTVPLQVPASSEIVLEGWVDPSELVTEGPFGDHTGFYSLADQYPVFHVECITHRRQPIYHTTLVGRPPQEDCWMTAGIERILLPIL
ncbi:MAG: UbiD family decarboxylase, partial [Planctomycetota bacterium]|nr:UbiD family decarboxylase [Planctomycetota bacterium]